MAKLVREGVSSDGMSGAFKYLVCGEKPASGYANDCFMEEG